MRRLLYCLLGSVLFHAALLWVPLPMSAGGAGKDDLLLVRVRLVEAPRSDLVKRMSRREELAERNGRARQARTEPRRVVPEPRRAEPNTTLKASKAAPATSKPAATPARTEPASETSQTPPVATAPARAKPVPEPRRTPPVVRRVEPAQRTAEATGTVRPKRGIDGARDIIRATPAEQITAGAEFSPVRYARTVKPRYPRKARRAGWEGTTLLKVLVNPDGAPSRVAVERTSGFDILDEAAVKAVRRWRFHPARRGTAPLSTWVRIPVAFRLEGIRR